ncbi:MAG: HPr family phosphocarrier protein [Ruminococcus sp.]|nr:HPr family phosphocarrier protein [Ruminococcus sp.]
MKSFKYKIKDELGIHARPAGLLCKTAKELDSEITIKKGDVTVSATRLMALMGLGIKCGDEVEVVANGGNEESSITTMKNFFEENL